MPISNNYFECEIYDEKEKLLDIVTLNRKTKAEYLKLHPHHTVKVVENQKNEEGDSFSQMFGSE